MEPKGTSTKDVKKQRLEYDSTMVAMQKSSNQIHWVTPNCSASVTQVGTNKLTLLPSLTRVPQSETKVKTITFVL